MGDLDGRGAREGGRANDSLDDHVRSMIDVRGRFIEDQHGRSTRESPCNANQLPLANTKVRALFGDVILQPMLRDERAKLHAVERRGHLGVAQHVRGVDIGS